MRKLLTILTIGFVILLVACSDKKEEEKNEVLTPYDYLNEYITLWENHDFRKMYDDYLLDRIKAKYSYTDFGERYEHLYETLEVSDLKVEIIEEEELTEQQLEELTEYVIPVNISFNTIAGLVEYQNDIKMFKENIDEFNEEETKDKDRWYVEWNHSLILPRLEDGDEVRIRTIPSARGEIIDRNGHLLATNGEVYEIGLTLASFNESSLPKLAQILNVSEEYIKGKYTQSWVQEHHFVPIKKVSLNDEETVSQAVTIDGVTTRIVIDRVYPYKEKIAHLIGYIGAINEEELERLKDEGYTASDRIGKRGLEQLFESELRGEDGVEIYITKANNSTQTIVRSEPKNGETIQLTIDMEVQEKLFDLLSENQGTAVTINPTTGEVTSLVSTPSFDPNDFILGMTNEKYQEFINDEANPNLNRFAATYSPGSTIKLMTSIAGLRAGQLDPNEERQINGKRWKKDESWGNYHVTRVYDHNLKVDLNTAITFSDNIYFAMLALDMGAEVFKNQLEQLGFGESIPFTYPLNTSQISNSGEFDTDILLADTSYGQGQLLVNIVHLASLYGGIANEGNVMKPLLLTDEQNEFWIENMVKNEDAEMLEQALRNVVVEGTAKNLNISGREMVAKTGTAELKSSYDDEEQAQHGWIVTYDQNKPDLLLAIMIENVHEHGGSGYVVDLAKQFFEE